MKIELFFNIELRQWIWKNNWDLIFFPWILCLSFYWTLTRFICWIWQLFSSFCLWKLSCFASRSHQLILSTALDFYLTVLWLDNVSTVDLAQTMLTWTGMLTTHKKILPCFFTWWILVFSEAFFKAKLNVGSWLIWFFDHNSWMIL